MESNKYQPNVLNFIKTANWQVAKYLLKKVHSERHDIKFHMHGRRPFYVVHQDDYIDFKYSGYKFIQRSLDFQDLGVLCSSNSNPSIKEVVILVTLDEETPIMF